MGIFYQQPPPPSNPPVPLHNLCPAISAVRGDSPPIKNPAALFSRIRQWDAPDPQPAQGVKSVIPAQYPFSIDTLGSPPRLSGARDPDLLWNIIQTWIYYPDPQPAQKVRSIIPPLYPVIVSVPPFMCGLNDPDYYWAMRQWDPPDPWPTQRVRSAIPALYPVIVNNPPPANAARLMNIVKIWDIADQRIPMPILFPQAPIINLPPFTHFGRTATFWGIMQTWIPLDPMPPRSSINLAPGISSIRGDSPPFLCGSYDPDLFWNIMWTWNAPDPQPERTKPTASPPGWSVDNPPALSFNRLLNIVRSWEPPPPMPQANKPFPVGALIIIDNPPFIHFSRTAAFRGIMQGWLPPDPQPPRPSINLPPGISSIGGDMPPLRSWAPPQTIMRSWQEIEIGRQKYFIQLSPGALICVAESGDIILARKFLDIIGKREFTDIAPARRFTDIAQKKEKL